MEHQPFESWLLEDQILTTEQERALRQHTLTCLSCAALQRANFSLRATSLALPARGFSQRFAARLAVQHQTDQRRVTIGLLILIGIGAVALAYNLWPLRLYFFITPAQFFFIWLNTLITFSAFLQFLTTLSAVLGRVASQIVPGTTWATTLLTFGGLFGIWLATLKYHARPPRLPEETQ